MQRRAVPYLIVGGVLVAGGSLTAMSSVQIVIETVSGSTLSESTIHYEVLRYDPWLVLTSLLLMIVAGFALHRAGRYAPEPPGRRTRWSLPGSAAARRVAGLTTGGLLLLWSVYWSLGALTLSGATFSVGTSPPAGHLVLVPLWAGGAVATAVAGSACVYGAGRARRPLSDGATVVRRVGGEA